EGLSAGRRDDLWRAGLRRGVRHGGRSGHYGDGEDGRALQTAVRRRGGGGRQLMRRGARRIWVFVVCPFFLFSLAAARPVPLCFSRPARMRLLSEGVKHWARACLMILGLKINVHRLSDDLHSTRRLLVSNHQSYLDIIIIAAVFPTLFVAKTQVGRWPL